MGSGSWYVRWSKDQVAERRLCVVRTDHDDIAYADASCAHRTCQLTHLLEQLAVRDSLFDSTDRRVVYDGRLLTPPLLTVQVEAVVGCVECSVREPRVVVLLVAVVSQYGAGRVIPADCFGCLRPEG